MKMTNLYNRDGQLLLTTDYDSYKSHDKFIKDMKDLYPTYHTIIILQGPTTATVGGAPIMYNNLHRVIIRDIYE